MMNKCDGNSMWVYNEYRMRKLYFFVPFDVIQKDIRTILIMFQVHGGIILKDAYDFMQHNMKYHDVIGYGAH